MASVFANTSMDRLVGKPFGRVGFLNPGTGAWLSWLERCLHMAEVGGSSPPAPTIDHTWSGITRKRRMTTNENLREQFLKLIDLQAVDAEIFDFKSQKADFPRRLEEIDKVLNGKKTGMEEASEALKQLQVDKSDKENDLADAEAKIKKFEGELALIKTNKEYSAMLEQINSAKADVSLAEEKILESMDKIETAQVRCEEEKKAFDEEAKKSDAEKATIQSEESEVATGLAELLKKRDTLTGGMGDQLLKTYERVLENRGRRALSRINGEMCEECNMRLRPQVINEVRLQKKLVICENCSRILYTEDLSPAANSQ